MSGPTSREQHIIVPERMDQERKSISYVKYHLPLHSFLKTYGIRMKTGELNIKGWSGYIFTNMTNSNDFDPEFLLVNDLKMDQ